MDGRTLSRELRLLLSEPSGSTYLDDKSSYDQLFKAASEFVARTRVNTSSQVITTVATQAAYTLNADFLDVWTTDDQNRKFIKYYDGSFTSFLYDRDYAAVLLANSSSSVPVPSQYSISDGPVLDLVSGTASIAGLSVNGEATLTDTSSPTQFANVSVGDTVHNTVTGASGYVLYKTSNTVLVTALFDGTNDDWAMTDSYIIAPQGRYQIVLDPPPSTAGHTVTIQYVQRPAPVYSPYGFYRLPVDCKQALICYAAWVYKHRDREPNYASELYKYFDMEVRKVARTINKSLGRGGFKVNFIKSGFSDRSRR